MKEKFQNAIAENIIEAKVDEFGSFVIESQDDCVNPRRHEVIVQSFIDEVYRLKSLGQPPKVEITITPAADGFFQVNWNLDFNQLLTKIGKKLAFHSHYPLVAAGIANRTLLSAANMECDLYLSRPMSTVVGDKLYEASRSTVKTRAFIETLQVEVAFPDLRKLVNRDHIDFKEVLKIRRKAKKFRAWLQSESDRDRNALIAYHHEVAKESGFIKNSRKFLELFGAISGIVAPTLIKTTLQKNPSFDPVTGALVGAAVGKASNYILDLAAKREKDWQPIAFGNWYVERITDLLDKPPQDQPFSPIEK